LIEYGYLSDDLEIFILSVLVLERLTLQSIKVRKCPTVVQILGII